MAKGETDYEIWSLVPTGTGWTRSDGTEITTRANYKKLAVCDTQANVVLKLARMKWPKNGLTIIPVRRK